MHLYKKIPKVKTTTKVSIRPGIDVEMPQGSVIFPRDFVRFNPIDDDLSERPVDYKFVIKGFDFATNDEVTDQIVQNPYRPETPHSSSSSIECNGIVNGENGYQLLSILDFDLLGSSQFRNSPIVEFYDLEGTITSQVGNYAFDDNQNLEVVSLPGLVSCTNYLFWNGMPNLRAIELPKLENPTTSPEVVGWLGQLPVGINLTLPISLQTANAGNMHAGIQFLIDNNKVPNITWVD